MYQNRNSKSHQLLLDKGDQISISPRVYQNHSERYLAVFCIDPTPNVCYDFIRIITLQIGIKKDQRPDNLERNWPSVLLFQGHKKQQKKHVHATVSAVATSFATNAEEPGKVLSLKEFQKSENKSWEIKLALRFILEESEGQGPSIIFFPHVRTLVHPPSPRFPCRLILLIQNCLYWTTFFPSK